MLNGIILVIFVFILFAVSIICKNEVIRSQRNPSPKFENDDKRFKDVKMYKTREISVEKKQKE